MIHYYDHADSTNLIARDLAMQGAGHGTVVHAKKQSAGKGQYGRTFDSPAGGLYFSLLLQPELKIEKIPLITLAVGLACRDVLYSLYDIAVQIKWPNDLYLESKKLAGILCETLTIPNKAQCTLPVVIVGVGINVNTVIADFSEEVRPIVTSLRDYVQAEIDIDILLARIVDAIIARVSLLGVEPRLILSQWQNFDYLANKRVVYTNAGTSSYGTGIGITHEGYYRFQDDCGIEHCIVGGQLRPLNVK